MTKAMTLFSSGKRAVVRFLKLNFQKVGLNLLLVGHYILRSCGADRPATTRLVVIWPNLKLDFKFGHIAISL